MADVAPAVVHEKPPLVPSNAKPSSKVKRVKVEIKLSASPAGLSGNYEHRHFESLHPTCNKLLQKRWEEYVRSIHLHRLRTAKPSIDDSKPKVYKHLDMRLKKTQMEEERVHNIEKNNNILFNRIMFQKLSDTEVSNILESRSYDMRRNHIVEAHNHIRKSRLDKILRENQIILQRIEEKAPNYNRLDWYSDRYRNLGYLCNIAQYPKLYLDLLDEGKANYDLVRPITHQSPRVVFAAGHRKSHTAPDQGTTSSSLLRPKTRGAPTSSSLILDEDTLAVAHAAEDDKGKKRDHSDIRTQYLEPANELEAPATILPVTKTGADEDSQTTNFEPAVPPTQAASLPSPKQMSVTATAKKSVASSSTRQYSVEQLVASSSRRASLAHTHQQEHKVLSKTLSKPATPKRSSCSVTELSTDLPLKVGTPSTLVSQSKAISTASLASSIKREKSYINAKPERAYFAIPSNGASVADSKKNSIRETPKRHSVVDALELETSSTYFGTIEGKSVITDSDVNQATLTGAALADNRAIKMIEDEESAKAAIYLSDDLADLGIFDCNSNDTVDSENSAAKSNKESSRPSSGWSEFDNASPDEEVPLLDSVLLEEVDVGMVLGTEGVIACTTEADDDTAPIETHESAFPLNHTTSSLSFVKIPNPQYDEETEVQELPQPQPSSLAKQILLESTAFKAEHTEPKQAPTKFDDTDSAPEFADDEFDYLYDMGISKRPQESNIPNDTQNENLEEIDVRKMEENHESRHEDTEMSPAESALVPSDESHNHEGSRKNTGDIAESCLATVTSISVGKSHGSTESTDHAPANMEDIAQREAASMDEGLDTTQTQLLNKLSFEYSAEDNHIQPEEAAIENGKTFSEPTAGFSPIIGTSSEVDYEAENNTQMKKITPLPPIDPNNRPLSSKSSKPSLSRPLSARILGPILTPPHNSRPTSRPISGYQQENSVLVASRRVSLPALVNAASIPSSRPLSGSTPLLNNVAPIETEPYSKDVESGGEKMNGSSRGSASAYSRRGIAGESKTGSMTPLSLPISRPLSPIKQGSQKTLAVDLLPADMNAHSNISGSRNDEATLGTIGSDIEGTPNNDDDDGDIAFNDFEQPPIEFEGDHPAPQNIEEPLRAGADTFARTHAENSHIIGEENSGNMDEGSYLITAEYDIANAMLAKTARPVSNQSAQLIDGSEIPKLQSETSNDASAFVEAQLVHKALESIESGDKNAPEATERSLGKGSQQFFEVQDLMKENGKAHDLNIPADDMENDATTKRVSTSKSSETPSDAEVVETEAVVQPDIKSMSHPMPESVTVNSLEEPSAPKQEKDVDFNSKEFEVDSIALKEDEHMSGVRNEVINTMEPIHLLLQHTKVPAGLDEILPEAEHEAFHVSHEDKVSEKGSNVFEEINGVFQALDGHEIEAANAVEESIADHALINSFSVVPTSIDNESAREEAGAESISEGSAAGQSPVEQPASEMCLTLPADKEPIDEALSTMDNIEHDCIVGTEAASGAAAPLEQTAIEEGEVAVVLPSEPATSQEHVKSNASTMNSSEKIVAGEPDESEVHTSELIAFENSGTEALEGPSNLTTATKELKVSDIEHVVSYVDAETTANEVATDNSFLTEAFLPDVAGDITYAIEKVDAESGATSATTSRTSNMTEAKSMELTSNSDAAPNVFESFGEDHTSSLIKEQTTAIENELMEGGANEIKIDEVVHTDPSSISANTAQGPNPIYNDHGLIFEKGEIGATETKATGPTATEIQPAGPTQFDAAPSDSSVEHLISISTKKIKAESEVGGIESAETITGERNPAVTTELNDLKNTEKVSDDTHSAQSTPVATYLPMPPTMSNHESRSTLERSRRGSRSGINSQLHYATEASETKPLSPRSVRTPKKPQSRTQSGKVKSGASLEELVPI